MKGLLISDFNIENLSAYLKRDKNLPAVDLICISYGEVFQTLLGEKNSGWSGDPDFVVIWTRPEGVLGGFRDLLRCSRVSDRDLDSEVDAYAGALVRASKRTRAMFAPTWVIPPFHPTQGLLDLAPDGVARALMRINMRLLESIAGVPAIYPLWADKWMQLAGAAAFNFRLWYLGKIPFANEVFKAAARDIKSALRGLNGQSKKIVILDLDDILWGGVVGDTGWEGITLGGHDSAGEALVDFQRELQALSKRGILLAIVSKNEESIAMEAITKHPEMVLKLDDFAGWRINWGDKAENVVNLMAELNLGLDSAVFIDDSPVERARVREALPQLLVPEWPLDKRFYPQALLSLDCFDSPSVTEEDRQRSCMSAVDRKRKQSKIHLADLGDWLATLRTIVRVEELNQVNLSRAAQLLNKTNQMNLATRRMSEAEFEAWAKERTRKAWTFRVSDRFGDSGLTGILTMEVDDSRARIVDFVLSCRVMGRKIEEAMLHVAITRARLAGVYEVYANYQATSKNKPCYDFFARSGLTCRDGSMFVWNAAQPYPLDSAIRLVCDDSVTSLKTSAKRNPSHLLTEADRSKQKGNSTSLTHG